MANVDGATKRVPPKSLTVEETYPDQIKPNLTTLSRAMGSMPYTGGRLSGPLLALFFVRTFFIRTFFVRTFFVRTFFVAPHP